MAAKTPSPAAHPARPDFVRPGDYTTPFWADALAAFPKAPRITLKAIWWSLARKRVRARNHLHAVVGRRLIFAMRLHLRPAAPTEPAPELRCAVVIPAFGEVSVGRIEASRGSLQTGMDSFAVTDAAAFAELVGALDHDLILILPPGDVLLPGAAEALAATFADERVQAAFADEVVALPGLVLPVPKPGFDEDLLEQVDYAGPFLAIRRAALLAMGSFLDSRDLLLRIAKDQGEVAVGHILGPIVGRDMREADAAPAFPFHPPGPRNLADPPLVSVIVPTRDRIDLLGLCLDGLLHATDYPKLEVIVADNGSSDPDTLERLAAYARDPRMRVVPMPGPFNFSRLNNDAVAFARGDVLVFLNNDIEVIEPTWLGALVAETVRPEVGAVGATLLYPNGLVQHAGVVVGLAGGPAGHAFHLFRQDHPGFLHMLRATRRVSAVTAACLAVRRETFLAHGGFDAEAFPVALNDVDLCLRLDAAGLRNLNVGAVRLLHKESASRPSDRHPQEEARYARELAAFTARWPHRLARDPWYNPHHGWAAADFSVPRWTGGGTGSWPPAEPC